MANYVYQATSLEDAQRVLEEYLFIGRYATLDTAKNQVTLHALPPKKEKKKRNDKDVRKTDRRESEESSSESASETRNTRRSNGFTRGKYIEGTD